MAVEFQQIEKRTGNEMFNAPAKEAKWSPVILTMLGGKDVFIPGMTRTQLETVRGLVKYRKYGTLRSRTTEVEGVEGKLLRIVR